MTNLYFDCRLGYSSGLHVWEFTWPQRQHGTHAVVGVATRLENRKYFISKKILYMIVCCRDAPLHTAGYTSLVGSNQHSWGWDLGRCRAFHNTEKEPGRQYPGRLQFSLKYFSPNIQKKI